MILKMLFMLDLWLVLIDKATQGVWKEIREELMPVPWNSNKWWDWWKSEDEKKNKTIFDWWEGKSWWKVITISVS